MYLKLIEWPIWAESEATNLQFKVTALSILCHVSRWTGGIRSLGPVKYIQPIWHLFFLSQFLSSFIYPMLLPPSIRFLEVCTDHCSMIVMHCINLQAFVNSSPPGQNGCHFAADIFKCIFMNEKNVFWSKFHWIMFYRVQLIITQHWFRW